MKMLTMLATCCFASSSIAAEVVKVCKLGTTASSKVELIRDHNIASTYIYYLRQAGKRTPLFGTKELSRGAEVQAQCAGKKMRRSLVVSGEFTANALQGVLLTNSRRTAHSDRLDFAEKMRPGWLYLGSDQVIIVVPASGYGESSARYTLYRQLAGGDGADRTEHVNELPPTHGFEVIKLK